MKSVKNMKMLSTAVIAAVLTVSAFALPVHAEENTTSASTEFSYVQKNEPTYTVSIPSALALSKEGKGTSMAFTIGVVEITELDEGYQKKNDYYLSQCYNRGKVDELVKSEVSVISTSDFLSGNCSVRW